MVCDGLRWSAMLLEAQNGRKTAHFIAACGWTYRPPTELGPKNMQGLHGKKSPYLNGSNLNHANLICLYDKDRRKALCANDRL